MNERIEKFIDDAKLTAVSEMFESELEKFAELIIAECAHQAEIWDSDPLSGNSIAYEIKKHFKEKNT